MIGSIFEPIVLAASLIITFLFFIYGYNCFYLLTKARKYRNPISNCIKGVSPEVAIHLPIYNEKYVFNRLIEACTKIVEDYGKDRVRIMVLDDSDDETTQQIAEAVKRYSELGFKIEHQHRNIRKGFKAGALQNALNQTSEEYIAIFDSDFIPPPNFLRKTVPYMMENDKIAIVQCKWAHVNREYNFITRAVAIGMDAHFLIEQPGRYMANCFLNFNGSGGLIRRKSLIEAGGWQDDTLTEDLDVSYRIQMLGYRIAYIENLEVPGEVTPTLTSFKRQQARWARGSLQTGKKLIFPILYKKDIGIKQKLEAYIHLTYYLVHPLMLAAFIIASIVAISDFDSMKILEPPSNATLLANSFISYSIWILFALAILCCTIATWLYYMVSLKLQGMSLRGNLHNLIVLGLIGYGISVSNTIQAAEALFSESTGVFNRTPKYDIRSKDDKWRDKKYQVNMNITFVLELAAATLGIFAIFKAVMYENWGIIPILALYTIAYFFVIFFTISHSIKSII